MDNAALCRFMLQAKKSNQMSYRAHIYPGANFKTTVGRRPNFIEYLKNTTVESQTDTCMQVSKNANWLLFFI